jgi:hypothetical protein
VEQTGPREGSFEWERSSVMPRRVKWRSTVRSIATLPNLSCSRSQPVEPGWRYAPTSTLFFLSHSSSWQLRCTHILNMYGKTHVVSSSFQVLDTRQYIYVA